jgi:hypothetical protein
MSITEPKLVEVERHFAQFVRTVRGGTIVRDIIPDAPSMEPNADYYFADDNIIAELKCLHTEVDDRDQLNKRFLSVCQRLGYSAEHALSIAFRKAPLPRDVAQGVIRKSLNHVRDALRKANRQISATKRQLGHTDALGLVIISNEKNTGLTATQLMRFMFQELRAMTDAHIDGLIYMTPNLYHAIEHDDVARSLWLPAYRSARTRLTDFVDELGTAWCRFREEFDGDLVAPTKLHEPPLSYFDVRPSLPAHIKK